MLNFAFPAALLLGLSILPAALFYFLRMRFRKQPVGSAFLWLKIKKESGASGNRLRWKSILLFLLQIIVLLALSASAALPQLLNRSEQLPGVIYLLDASASMAAREREDSVTTSDSEPGERTTRFSLASKQIIADIKELPPNTPVAVFLCDSRLRLLSENANRVDALLDATTAGDGSFLEKPIAEELQAWMALKGREWSAVLVTDGGLDLGGHELLSIFGENIRTIDVGTNAGNIGLGNLRLPSDNFSGLNFTAVNQWPEAKDISVSLSRDGNVLTESNVNVPTGFSQQTIPCDASLTTKSGIYRLTIKDNSDAQTVDDSTALAVNPVRKIRVLHVGPENTFIQTLLSWPTIAYTQQEQFPTLSPQTNGISSS